MSIISIDESHERSNTSTVSAYEIHLEISMLPINEDDAGVSLWIDEKKQQREKRGVINHAITQLTEGRYSPIASTLNTSWDDVLVTQQQYYQRKVREALQAVLSVVVPGQEERMRSCLREEQGVPNVGIEPPAKRKRLDIGLVETLISAHNDAENWQTKRQILSLFVNDFSKTDLREMIPGLSKWRTDQARRDAIDVGEGQPVVETSIFRTRLDPVKTDHFIDYISRPCFLQDVAYGTRKLKPHSGGHAVIPAVIRTLFPSRIIAQYVAYCKDIRFQPASERTLFRILEVCSASMQKSWHGLDYITSEGVKGFECLQNIVGTLRNEQAVSLSWEKESKQQLSDAKRYLKADYKLYVSRKVRSPLHWCSSPTDPSFKNTCDHCHDVACDACHGLETAVKEIGAKIEDGSSAGLDGGTKRKLHFEYDKAKEAIAAWKAHNFRVLNQDLAKHDILSTLDGNNCLIVMDWS